MLNSLALTLVALAALNALILPQEVIGGSVNGKITSYSDAPIEGARVNLYDSDDFGAKEIMGAAITDTQGAYNIVFAVHHESSCHVSFVG